MQASRLKRVWRLLRAPLLGMVLGLLLLKVYGFWRIRNMTPEERRAAVRAHCERAQKINEDACRSLKVAPIYLPPDVVSEMLGEYSSALDIDPGNESALSARAYWRARIHDDRGARADFDELLRLHPDLSLAWYQRGRLRCDTGDHKGAIEDFTQALTLEPTHLGSAFLTARACCRMEIGDFRGALADYHDDLLGEEFRAGDYRLFPVGKCHQELGEHAKAVAAFNLYLEKTDSAAAHYLRGISRYKLGDRQEAFTDFQRALQDDGEERRAAQSYIEKFPSDPMSGLLKEALVRRPERE